MSKNLRKRKIAEILITYFKEIGKIGELADINRDKPGGLTRKLISKNYKSYSVALQATKSLYPNEWEALAPKKLNPLEQLKSALSTKPVEDPIDSKEN